MKHWKSFKALLQYIRFDNKATREESRAQDKLAPIRDIWTMFIAQLPKFFIPSTDMTIDKQVLPFCGHCPFRYL